MPKHAKFTNLGQKHSFLVPFEKARQVSNLVESFSGMMNDEADTDGTDEPIEIIIPYDDEEGLSFIEELFKTCPNDNICMSFKPENMKLFCPVWTALDEKAVQDFRTRYNIPFWVFALVEKYPYVPAKLEDMAKHPFDVRKLAFVEESPKEANAHSGSTDEVKKEETNITGTKRGIEQNNSTAFVQLEEGYNAIKIINDWKKRLETLNFLDTGDLVQTIAAVIALYVGRHAYNSEINIATILEPALPAQETPIPCPGAKPVHLKDIKDNTKSTIDVITKEVNMTSMRVPDFE